MPSNCLWSNRPDAGTREITITVRGREQQVHVCPDHEDELRRFTTLASRFTGLFLVLIGLTIAGVIAAGVAGSLLGIGASIIALGVICFALPFCTPQTIAAFGVRASIRIARVVAMIIVLIGIAMMML